jgi:hypothetical protein
MKVNMISLAASIMAYAEPLPEGTIITAKRLLQFGSRAAVRQSLSRLARIRTLIRATRGIYVLPVRGRFGTRAPSPHAVAASLSNVLGEAIEPHGIAAANVLGLTTQVPVRPIYVTCGRSRKLRLGAQTLEVQHVPRWQMLMAERPAGKAIRALAWLGANNAPAALRELREKLPREEWKALAVVRPFLPIWMAEAVSEEMANTQ